MTLVAGSLLALSSCSTVQHTASTYGVDTEIYNLTVADLQVAETKSEATVEWEWNPLSTVSMAAQKKAAASAVLDSTGADVLVEPEYTITRRGLFRGGSVTVTGYPASYTNFHSMSMEEAQTIATLEGNGTVSAQAVPLDILSLSTGKSKVKTSKSLFPRRKRPMAPQNFVSIFGGGAYNPDTEEWGASFSLMYGHEGLSWGWYIKGTWARCDVGTYNEHYPYNYYETDMNCYTISAGGIKRFGRFFSVYLGTGVGLSHRHSETLFVLPVDIGFKFNVNKFALSLGFTGNVNTGNTDHSQVIPQVGIGYNF